jgi:hypothetical protein
MADSGGVRLEQCGFVDNGYEYQSVKLNGVEYSGQFGAFAIRLDRYSAVAIQ